MSKTQHIPPFAAAYAGSLLELAGEQNIAEQIGAELRDFQQLLSENATFRAYLPDPSVSTETKGETLKKVFGGKVSPLLLNFLGLVNEKGRLPEINLIAESYHKLLDIKLGKVEVDVTVAARLADAAIEQVRDAVSRALGRNAVIHQYVDESIIGGIVIRIGDKLIDGSVKAQLAALKRELLEGKK